jgi:hypothetical protein
MSFEQTIRNGLRAEDKPEFEGHEIVDSKRQYTIKGIETETLDLMRTAAKKQGMKVGAWVSARLREAAKKALEDDNEQDGFAELRDHIRRVEENQIQERENLRTIQDELNGVLRTQNNIMSKIISRA